MSRPRDFAAHLEVELEGLGKKEIPEVAVDPATAEPYVRFAHQDLCGLALSGGGIRSATFNLGLLQSLADKDVLGHFDYVSTVSGGGYVGGAVSAKAKRGGPWAPDDRVVRHMREFSRFLAPRLGLFSTDVWHAAFALVAGVAISLTATSGIVLAATVAMRELVRPGGMFRWLAVLVVIVCLTAFETAWAHLRAATKDVGVRCLTAASPIVGVVLLFALFRGGEPRASLLVGILGVLGLPLRVAAVVITQNRAAIRTTERTSVRLLGVAIVWFLLEQSLAPEFHAAVARKGLDAKVLWALVPGALSPIAAGALVAFREWFFTAEPGKGGAGRLAELPSVVRRRLPGLLAGVALVGAFALAALFASWFEIRVAGPLPGLRAAMVLGGSALCLALLAMLVDTPENRIHEFYRARIARAYVGASRTDVVRNRQSLEHEADDLRVRELPARPLHLVCCAANDVLGDGVRTLARGARSATLSRHGLSVQNAAVELEWLRLSSALTASAAAFNSLMGSVTMEVGPSVGFVLTALGLRLGLWVRDPSSSDRRVAALDRPLLFLRELFGLVALPPVTEENAVLRPRRKGDFVHLSDGGHFENLALYELVRRHCRYVIVSDAGADADRSFDDLANAVRRIRIDFGAEIEIDVSPLRPDESGRARQHAVVGTIHYDGKEGLDKGTIVYFKPALTGDEPADLLQYQRHNPTFPHESTVQQFYDEAQWEAYRRLGQHAGDEVFRFYEALRQGRIDSAEPLFSRARRRWSTLPAGWEARFLELSERCAALEEAVEGPLAHELFGELSDPEKARGAVQVAMIAQLMEDVWVGLDLEHTANHPLHKPWLAYMERWATTTTFRRYFPLVAPIFNDLFVKFVQYRLGVGPLRDHAGFEVRRVEGDAAAEGYAARLRAVDGRPVGAVSHEMLLRLEGEAEPIQVGVLHSERREGTIAWLADDLYVPDALLGGGFHSNFLEKVIEAEVDVGGLTAEVTVKAGDARIAGRAGARQWRVDLIDLYKSVGFTYHGPVVGEGADRRVVLVRRPRGNRS